MSRPLRLPHEAGTTGAHLVETPLFRLIQLAVTSIGDIQGAVSIDGPPGNGKTFAAAAAAMELSRPVYWLPLTGSMSLTSMYLDLIREITGETCRTRHTLVLHDLVRDLLGSHECWLFIDEAQWAQEGLLRAVRSIFDSNTGTDTPFGLVLFGYGLDATFKKEPGLQSRVSCEVTAAELSPGQVIHHIRRYHPMFARMNGPELYELWRYAGGNFRRWAHFLQKANSLGISTKERVTADDVEDLIALVGKSPLHRQVKKDLSVFEKSVTSDAAVQRQPA